MDIEPLWTLGGWFLLSNCMAAPKTSSSSPISELSFTKSLHLLQILTFFFILFLLINNSHQRNPSTMVSSETLKSSSSSGTGSTSTTNLHPEKTPNSRNSSKDAGREFGAEAHEVPSGPNPISNR